METNEDIFLAKWLNKDIDTKETDNFNESDEGKVYQRIVDIADTLEIPESFNSEELFNKIQQEKLQKKKATSKLIKLNTLYKVAACMALLASVFYFWKSNDVVYKSNYGEKLTISLPDASQVTLNSKSKITFDNKNWKNERTIFLEGEAFFEVQKGETFTVKTKEGSVTVLGTSFNVNSGNNFLEVKCFTGKVNVVNKNNTNEILTKGLATTFNNNIKENWTFNTAQNSWKEGISRFRETPLPIVLLALENEFNFKFKNIKKYQNEKFSGVFSHKEPQTALKTVLSAMDIKYSTKNNNIILLK
ncbi:FecR family protein [Tenacibaculum sp. M341]|uniref:FecR family protein n=1 Tax=Tenacibaculum sp. M341 TaxID=2530339 RepID=UPI00104E0511|nr:FecR family protein [Tenacibaculum sp. M341]TCI84962.1 FecR family protein [Tenacibaculum sp. M341]